MVFARESDAALASLVKQLDEAIAKHSDKKLSAFVNILGEDREAAEAKAKELAQQTKPQNVAIVVPVEAEDGPKNFGISPKADVTATLYRNTKVQASHAFDDFQKEDVDKVVSDISKIVN